MVFGYCRISTGKQNIERQERNILSVDSKARIVKEVYTGTTGDRPKWRQLLSDVRAGDTIIFDSVSRMARNASEGVQQYMSLYRQGVRLKFLKEPGIDTDVYRETLQNAVPLTGGDVDLILSGVNAYLLALAKRQIEIAFEQAEKEVSDLHERTREGIETARRQGKQIGREAGKTVTTKKQRECAEIIRKHSRDFGGALSDGEVQKLCGISRNTYYKYKAALKN